MIRHKNDFGAILFLDRRFADVGTVNNLSDWVKAGVPKTKPTFEANIAELTRFFKAHGVARIASNATTSTKSSFETREPSAKRPRIDPAAASKVKVTAKVKPKKIVVSNSKVTSVLQYKATDLVSKLKENLSKTDMLAFKTALKTYKAEGKLDEFKKLLGEFKAEEKLVGITADELREFMKKEDLPEFDRFVKTIGMT